MPEQRLLVTHPVLVIALPCYNEERFLARAIQSLRAQTWTDFRVLISDNASTDRTPEIAQAAAAADDRFHYHRQPVNLGSCGNFNFCLDATESPLMMWLGAHDYLDPTYLEKLVPPMLRDPKLSAAYCHAAWVDEKGDTFYVTKSPGMARLPANPLARFVLSARYIDFCTELNNVLRREFIQTRLTHTWGCDMILLADLAFHGPFYCVPEQLYFFHRVPEEVRSEDYMKRLTGKEGVGESREAFIDNFDRRLKELAPRNPMRPLASMVLRAFLQKRYMPEKAGPLATAFKMGASMRQKLRSAFARA